MHIDPLYSIAGVLVGMLVGLTGVGGGSLMTPVLVLAFGFHPATAVGTDLLYASATKLVGTGVHGWRGTVDWRIVRRLATGSLPATVATIALLNLGNAHSGQVDRIITIVLGAALILTGIGTLFRHRIVTWLSARVGEVGEKRTSELTVLLGAALGLLVTLTSVGAGALGMTALLVLYPKLPIARLVGTDIAHAVPLTLVAGLGHLMLGTVDGSLLVSLLIGSVPGVIAGSLIASRVSDRVLTPILATTLTIVGVKLIA